MLCHDLLLLFRETIICPLDSLAIFEVLLKNDAGLFEQCKENPEHTARAAFCRVM
jgi:hypothetical protein